jgi:hypothetical protein
MSGRAGGRRIGLTILGVVCVCVGSGRVGWWCVYCCYNNGYRYDQEGGYRRVETWDCAGRGLFDHG